MKIYEALDYQRLYHRLKNQSMNIKLAYKLNKLNSKILTEAAFYEESLQKILNEYAQKDENGNLIQNQDQTGILIKPDYLEVCHKEINELQSINFDISDILFTLDELEALQITPAELSCIESLIVE